MATDAVGLQLLLADPGVLECHTHWVSAVRFSEIGASEVVLRAGYNIGSLMLRYQVRGREGAAHRALAGHRATVRLHC